LGDQHHAVAEAAPTPLDRLLLGADPLVVVLEGVEKPGNLGAMVRTAAAAGCVAVLAVGPVVDAFSPQAIRNSTGAVFALPTVAVADDAAAIGWLRERGVTIAAALADGGADCYTARWGGAGASVAVVVGPEHAGLGEAWREAADVKLTIPMAAAGGAIDSLNAANAAAVLLFEAVRRRGVN
ncbi:MAG: TrmH family RNA methyltransferase, partial [Planctomycetota bacterium]